MAHPDLTQSNLWQIPVPENCVNKPFDYLFMNLLKKKLICISLYRLKGAVNNEYPYVYTNPQPNTIISHRDRAFVLGKFSCLLIKLIDIIYSNCSKFYTFIYLNKISICPLWFPCKNLVAIQIIFIKFYRLHLVIIYFNIILMTMY